MMPNLKRHKKLKCSLPLCFFAAFCLLCTGLQAQNLVPNPSFEEYSSCPWNECDIHLATGWYSAGYTPDYFNACENLGWGWSVPLNGAGFQDAFHGNAYALTGAFALGWSGREYIECELITTLEPGVEYFVNFHVSLVDNPTANCGCSGMGVLFSTLPNPIGTPCDVVPGIIPQNFAHVFTSQVITDTTNWTTIGGSFIADSLYRYLSIGNFFDDANTSYQKLNPDRPECFALYYIDDIYVGTDSLVNIRTSQFETTIEIFPNPAGEFIKINSKVNIILPMEFELLNASGVVVKRFYVVEQDQEIDLQQLAQGFYILKANSKNNNFIKKLIIN